MASCVSSVPSPLTVALRLTTRRLLEKLGYDVFGDAVNGLTYLLLEVVEEMRMLQPSSMIQLSRKNPDRFLKRALRIVRTGFGQPSIFNTEAIVQELLRQGKAIEDARRGGASFAGQPRHA